MVGIRYLYIQNYVENSIELKYIHNTFSKKGEKNAGKKCLY